MDSAKTKAFVCGLLFCLIVALLATGIVQIQNRQKPQTPNNTTAIQKLEALEKAAGKSPISSKLLDSQKAAQEKSGEADRLTGN